MISTQTAMRVCGFLYLFILITNAAGVGLGNRNNETDFDSMLIRIAENPGRYRMSLNITIISHLAILAITTMLYLSFGSYNMRYALIGSAFRLAEGLTMIISELSIFKLLDIAQEYIQEENTETIRAIVAQIMEQKNTRVDIGLLFLAIGAAAYCIILVQSGVAPSRIAWLGLTAGVLSGLGIIVKLFSGFSLPAMLGMVMMMVFEMLFGGWLLFYSQVN